MPTTMFAALAALHAGLDREGVVPGFDVVDGGPTVNAEPTSLHVGYSSDEGTAADGEQRGAEGYGEPRSEEYDIALTFYTLTGDGEEAGAADSRALARDAYRAVEAYVVGNPQLGGTVEQAVMGARFRFRQVQTERGAATELVTTVTCTAYIDNN